MKMKHLYQVVDRLAIGYELQLQRFREMLEIARHQKEMISSGKSSQLEESLMRRQKLMEEIDETNEELAVLRKEVEEILHLKRFDLKKVSDLVRTHSSEKLVAILGELGGVIEEIRKIDQESTRLLEKQLQEIKETLQGVRDLRRAHSAYQGKYQPGSAFLDTKK